jgi:hypothetical protein
MSDQRSINVEPVLLVNINVSDTDSEAPILAHIIDHNGNAQSMIWRLKDMLEKCGLAATLLSLSWTLWQS